MTPTVRYVTFITGYKTYYHNTIVQTSEVLTEEKANIITKRICRNCIYAFRAYQAVLCHKFALYKMYLVSYNSSSSVIIHKTMFPGQKKITIKKFAAICHSKQQTQTHQTAQLYNRVVTPPLSPRGVLPVPKMYLKFCKHFSIPSATPSQ